MTRCHINGLVDDVVMITDDGVSHFCVDVTWLRGSNAAFHAFCDMAEKLPSYRLDGTIELANLRVVGVRYSTYAYEGRPTCLACITVRTEPWVQTI